MATMPVQKPGRSKQDYGTPAPLLMAVCDRLKVSEFSFDFAASDENAVAGRYYTQASDALGPNRPWAAMCLAPDIGYGQGFTWGWLNPPFADIAPWVEKAAREAALGLHLAMLIPASVGANWWKAWVEPYAYALHLNPRVKFVGCTDMYPKDCSVLIYTPERLTGAETWEWMR
jgi:phage N-6-adenine-methyltransferase